MCGRLACGLQPQEICNCCCYRQPGGGDFTKPQWIDCHNLGKTYKPSYNICPTDVAPVLLSGAHLKTDSRVLAPMIFGVIPYWSQLSEKTKYSTICCRIETIQTSKLYSKLLQKGQRCVVISNGYYEWQSQPKGKTPYFIHAQQPEGISVDDPSSWNLQSSPEAGSAALNPIKLAALFEMSSSDSGEEMTLSFTIITKEASSEMSWLHKRMPAILETTDQLDAWLDFEEVNAEQALGWILQKVNVICVPVSNSVNTVTNKDISCIRPEKKPKENVKKNVASVSLLKTWLEKGQKRKSDGDDTESASEKIKKEKD